MARAPPSPAFTASPDMPLQYPASSTFRLPNSPQSPESKPLACRNMLIAFTAENKRGEVAVAELLPERPRLPTGPADWEAKKDIIRDLYMDKNMILNEVMDIMITKYRFKATARMYKGQFAKWKWTKYNKSGNPSSAQPTKSRAAKRQRRSDAVTNQNALSPMQLQAPETVAAQPQHILVPQVEHLQYRLLHFQNEEWEVEWALNAYASLISHWSERETPWRTAREVSNDLHEPPSRSILQLVRAAQDFFLTGRPQLGGDMLRQAFLSIESAVENELSIEALWDCCLAVPQLVLSMGWTDILIIFSRYLYQLTSIKLPGHPITKITETLYKISTRGMANLEAYVMQGWTVWLDCVGRVRGRQDDVTIHLKRGYVTLINPRHKMARDILCDFGHTVHKSLAKWGAPATTSRILELEHLLVRMFVPLFTPESASRAKVMLTGIVARMEGKTQNKGLPANEWQYLDRYMVFSANNFLASISGNSEDHISAEYRRRALDTPRDLFWLQTSLLLEQRLRVEGGDAEADGIMQERMRVQMELGYHGELQMTG